MRYKTLFDTNKQLYFEIKRGEIVYLKVPKLWELSQVISFQNESLYLRTYLTKYGQLRYVTLQDRAYRKLFTERPIKKKWSTEDLKTIRENSHLGLEQLKDKYFPHVSYNALAGFVFRSKKRGDL